MEKESFWVVDDASYHSRQNFMVLMVGCCFYSSFLLFLPSFRGVFASADAAAASASASAAADDESVVVWSCSEFLVCVLEK